MKPVPPHGVGVSELRPADHVEWPMGPLAFLHPALRPLRARMVRRSAVRFARWTIAGLVAAIASQILTGGFGTVAGAWIGASLVLAGLLAALCDVAVDLLSTAVGHHSAVLDYVDDLAAWTARSVEYNHRDLSRALAAVLDDRTPAMEDVRLRLCLRLAEIERIDDGAHRIGGTDGWNSSRANRIAAIRTAVDEATADRTRISGETAERLASSYAAAAAIAGPRATPTAPRATGSARINRLVENAEQALAIDPDLVDAGGARIDALVREHLPRLLARHAELSLCTPLDGIADADVRLEEGVELVRASVAEAIAGLRHVRADALRTEIGFLRLRRDGTTIPNRTEPA